MQYVMVVECLFSLTILGQYSTRIFHVSGLTLMPFRYKAMNENGYPFCLGNEARTGGSIFLTQNTTLKILVSMLSSKVFR